MNRRIRQFVVGGLALWLMALSGIVYPQLTAHMAQHAHHNAATHATALGSWLCTAADAVEGTVVDVSPVRYSTFLEQASTESVTSGTATASSLLPERLDGHGMPE